MKIYSIASLMLLGSLTEASHVQLSNQQKLYQYSRQVQNKKVAAQHKSQLEADLESVANMDVGDIDSFVLQDAESAPSKKSSKKPSKAAKSNKAPAKKETAKSKKADAKTKKAPQSNAQVNTKTAVAAPKK